MSYLVLARKWRPQKFDDVVGQPHISGTLKNAIKENRVAHAFLFCGMRGIGKTTTARILAKALNCHNPVDYEPCCECPACTEISNGNSMDVIEIDGASNNSVDDIRELREKVKYRPNRDKFKIYIIDEVHQLSNQAFNALLKTLEEPPEHIIFIFATTESHKIPMTILSRCQRYNFRKIGEEEMKKLLRKIGSAENLTIDDESISLISWASEGSMRDAQSLLDQAIAYCGEKIEQERLTEILGIIDRKFLGDLYLSISKKDGSQILGHTDSIISAGYNLSHFYDKLIEYNRDLIVAKLTGTKGSSINSTKEELKTLQKISENFTLMQLQQFHRVLIDSEYQIKKSSHPRISLEMMLVKLTMIEPVVSIKEIIEKIDEISKGMPLTQKFQEDIDRTPPPVIEEKLAKEPQKITKQNAITAITPTEPEPEKSDNKREALFSKLLKEFEEINGPHYTILNDAENIEIEDDKIVLVYGKDSDFFDDTIDNEEFKEKVEKISSKLFGKKLKFISRLSKDEDVNEISVMKDKPKVRKEGDLPLIVQKAIDIFNGEIIER